jgi:uncharacterized phage protein (TIGR02218 family)
MSLKPIYLYKFVYGERVYPFTNVGLPQSFDGDNYLPEDMSHTEPTQTEDVTKFDVSISVPFDNTVALLSSTFPLPSNIELYIYKFYAGVTDPEIYWRGKVVRTTWNDSRATIECNTTLSSLLIEGLPETNQILCNARLGNGRCPVLLANFRIGVTVDSVANGTDGVCTVTVTGITQPDGWFERGTIKAPNGDLRFIVAHVGDVLTLDNPFPATTLADDDAADIYPGCDRSYATCIGKFGSETGDGDAFVGNPIVPKVNPHEYGRML